MSTVAVWMPERASVLTRQQRDVLCLLALGHTNVQIAERLGMTPGRVGSQVGRIVERLGFSRRAEIVTWMSWQAALHAPHVEARPEA
ncbi:MAG: helix-turn-helix transcriptional regulator [Chloroflexota bacterium]